jgi:peptidoglycan/xylan/chitin deacetylase (PgdA/CDA1 family)
MELNIPATLFVVTGYLDTDRPFPFDEWSMAHSDRVPPEGWRPLTWRQCLEMERGGLVEIGTHSHTHQDFRRRPDDFKRDLLTSLALLRQKLGARRFTLALPYGSRALGFADPAFLDAAREADVLCALTTEIELVTSRTSPFSWGRFEVNQHDTGATLAGKLGGWFNWTAQARELFRLVTPPTIRGVR